MRCALRLPGLLLALVSTGTTSCTFEEPIAVADHIVVPPLATMEGVALGMGADAFVAARPDAEVEAYLGFREYSDAYDLFFGFSKPCMSEDRVGQPCEIRGRLETIAVRFAREQAGGQTLFVEHWGEFFRDHVEPSHCFEYIGVVYEAPLGTEGRHMIVHWEDPSGLWVDLREVTYPLADPRWSQTSYSVGRTPHSHEAGDDPAPRVGECGKQWES